MMLKMMECKKITQVVNYLLRKDDNKKLDEYKLVKLVWAADRFHLRNYAKLVTGDHYYAMAKGPVGSMTKDVIEFNEDYIKLDTQYLERFIKKQSTNGSTTIESVDDPDMDELSLTDIEALDFAWSIIGGMTPAQAIEFTHNYPEWTVHEGSVANGGRMSIDLDRMLQDPVDSAFSDPFSAAEYIYRLNAVKTLLQA
jgi:uncharacterized phage-associated protein